MVRWHQGSDGWGRDSYRIPEYAVAGSSDTGMSYDSPAPTDRVIAELESLRHYLAEHGLPSYIRGTPSGNLFMVKRWVVVSGKNYDRARKLADGWLKTNHSTTHYIHDAV